MINRNYPISSHYFPNLIEDGAIYVDKTQFIVPLLAKKNVLIGVCFTMQKRGISGHLIEAI
jgi:hypothetical protein